MVFFNGNDVGNEKMDGNRKQEREWDGNDNVFDPSNAGYPLLVAYNL
jgi:hypothetical protein